MVVGLNVSGGAVLTLSRDYRYFLCHSCAKRAQNVLVVFYLQEVGCPYYVVVIID